MGHIALFLAQKFELNVSFLFVCCCFFCVCKRDFYSVCPLNFDIEKKKSLL